MSIYAIPGFQTNPNSPQLRTHQKMSPQAMTLGASNRLVKSGDLYKPTLPAGNNNPPSVHFGGLLSRAAGPAVASLALFTGAYFVVQGGERDKTDWDTPPSNGQTYSPQACASIPPEQVGTLSEDEALANFNQHLWENHVLRFPQSGVETSMVNDPYNDILRYACQKNPDSAVIAQMMEALVDDILQDSSSPLRFQDAIYHVGTYAAAFGSPQVQVDQEAITQMMTKIINKANAEDLPKTAAYAQGQWDAGFPSR